MRKKRVQKKIRVWIIAPAILIAALFIVFLFKENYVQCLAKHFTLCVTSKKYTSLDKKFSFRYPNSYPLSVKNGSELMAEYRLHNIYNEWATFSNTFEWDEYQKLGEIKITNKSPDASTRKYGQRTLLEQPNHPEIGKYALPKVTYFNVGEAEVAKILYPRTSMQQFYSQIHYYAAVYDDKLYEVKFIYTKAYHKLPIKEYDAAEDMIVSTFSFK